ncbi:DUF4824 family protein [Pseudomonas sp. TTU2014-080ASC]|uniref:DUF4824 family protein n=1 Tax=Pseudomonas sp. TTU2014-080ASC TaxID=1729724 RepID=UPI00071867D0|nr:DUF4824 family protein [Pseudomonas sp. TTU2014-080ASC]KRW61892.1 hypothetical protein AO726_00180 [Pseudomonas sp. TTU2014-080ASC]
MARRSRNALLMGLALVVGVNAAVLVGAYSNREQPADSVLTLSNRELGSSLRSQAGLSTRTVNLWLGYRWFGQSAQESRIPAEHLPDLGFAVDPGQGGCELMDSQRRQVRTGFLVLEMNGMAYRRSLDEARAVQRQAAAQLRAKPQSEALQKALKEADKALSHELNVASRLFAVDLGLDRQALRAQYSDTSRYAVIGAQFRLGVAASYNGEQECSYYAYARPVVQRISVPRNYRHIFTDDAWVSGQQGERAFTASIAWGSRLEPWLLSAQRLAQ